MSKKSITFAPEMVTKETYNPVLEKTSLKKCDAWKSGEAMGIREMLIRTERGQRLDVNCRFRAEGIPDNMYQAQFNEKGQMLPDLNEETFDHTPPSGIVDPVDVLRYQEELSQRKAEMLEKKKKDVANASKSVPKEKSEGKAQDDPPAVTNEA